MDGVRASLGTDDDSDAEGERAGGFEGGFFLSKK